MAGFDTSYSTFVTWSKIVLPIFALALLSTMFLFSGKIDPTTAIPYSDIDVDKVAREKRMSNPMFSSVAEDGTSVVVTASIARPDNNDQQVVYVENVSSTFVSKTGDRLDVDAVFAKLNNDTSKATLSGGTRLSTTAGYVIESDTIYADFDEKALETESAVTGFGPLGEFNAGKMSVVSQGDNGEFLILFQHGVKIVYSPKTGN